MFSKAIIAATAMSAASAAPAFDSDSEKFSVEKAFDFEPFALNILNQVPELDQHIKSINWVFEALGLGPIDSSVLAQDQHLVQASNSVTDYWKTTVLGIMDFGLKYYVSYDW